MACRVLAIGQKMPGWIEAGIGEYQKRVPKGFALSWEEVPVAKKKRHSAQLRMAEEADSLRKRLLPQEEVIVFDVDGQLISTEALAQKLLNLRVEAREVALVIGGPDGLSQSVKDQAIESWSLGRLTLPHALVRVILSEQVYRAWSLINNHPYHRGS